MTISAPKGHFWSPEGPNLAKKLENGVFSVHTIQNLTFWNPNVAPQKFENFVPTDPPDPPYPPWHPPGGWVGQKWPKCIPTSPILKMNSEKNIFGRSKKLTYFFTRNVPLLTLFALLTWLTLVDMFDTVDIFVTVDVVDTVDIVIGVAKYQRSKITHLLQSGTSRTRLWSIQCAQSRCGIG